MNKSILPSSAVAALLVGSVLGLPAAEPIAPKLPIATPLQWKSTDVLIKPVSDATHEIVSVKDPTIVRYSDLWHIYTTVYSTSARTWSMVYLSFKDWAGAPKAKLHYIDQNPNLRGYHCAPQVFYFRPQKKWYLVYQVGVPGQNKMWVAYSTTADVADPNTWTRAMPMVDGSNDDSRKVGGLDYWIGGTVVSRRICWPRGC